MDNKKYIINVDWLELSLLGALSFENQIGENYQYGKFDFSKVQNARTKQFKDIYNIYYGSELFGNICLHPHSEILQSDLIKFKIENRFLYEAGYINLLSELLLATKWQFNNITRLDIACDLINFKNDVTPNSFISNFVASQWQKKDTGRPCKWSVYGVGHNTTGLRYGSEKSDRMAVLYNKTKELETSNKAYIKELHKQIFGASKDVFRFEIRLKNKEIKKIIEVDTGQLMYKDLLVLLQPEYIGSLFKHEFENYVKIIDTSNSAIELIDFENVYYPEFARFTTKSPNKLFRIKLAIKSLLEEYYYSTDINFLLQSIELTKTYGLQEHITKRFKYWRSAFKAVEKKGYNYLNILDFCGTEKQVTELKNSNNQSSEFILFQRAINERVTLLNNPNLIFDKIIPLPF